MTYLALFGSWRCGQAWHPSKLAACDLQIQESEAKPSSLALEALSKAQELCARSAGTRGTRQAYFIGRLMAKEHLVSGDPATAHRLLLLVAGNF